MILDWYIGCSTEEEKLARADLYKNSSEILVVLKKILARDLATSQTAATAAVNYELACWPMKQADLIGEQRALKRVAALLPEEPK
jgi:hypothetical protein